MSFPIIQKTLKKALTKDQQVQQLRAKKIIKELEAVLADNSCSLYESELIMQSIVQSFNIRAKQEFIFKEELKEKLKEEEKLIRKIDLRC